MATDIPIKYVNATKETDVEVVVFTKNFSTNASNASYCAWEILNSQSMVQFVYPASVMVSATCNIDGGTITAGPFPAKPGSTWEITQESAYSQFELTEVKGAPVNPKGTIVVKNKPPSEWLGQLFDVGISKSSRLVVTQPGLHVGDQVDFMIQPKLYFGVVRNMRAGDTFQSLEIISTLKMFDLSEFPNGLAVTIVELPSGGQYSFFGESL